MSQKPQRPPSGRDYLEKHNIANVLQDMTRRLVDCQPADPLEFMAKWLLERRERDPATVSENKSQTTLEAPAQPVTVTATSVKGETAKKEPIPSAMSANSTSLNAADPHRYWRLVILESSDSGWECYLKKLNLYPTDKAENPARGGKAYCCLPPDQRAGDGPQAAFDDDMSKKHRFASAAGKCNDWIMYDALTPIVVARVEFWQFEGGQNMFSKFEIQFSNDGEHWHLFFRAAVDPTSPFHFDSKDAELGRDGTPAAPPIDDRFYDQFRLPPNGTFTETSYKPIIMDKPEAAVEIFYNEKIALVVDTKVVAGSEGGDTLLSDESCRASIKTFIAHLTTVVATYERVIGRIPENGGGRGWNDRIRVEVGKINAGGLAAHGVSGISVGPAFLIETVRTLIPKKQTIHQIFFYELMRNYLFPAEFTPIFDYSLSSGRDNCGWVNQGFVNMTGCLLAPDMGIGFYYFGQDGPTFKDGMLKHLKSYEEGDYTWEDVFFKDHLLPWARNASLDNVVSAILVVLSSEKWPATNGNATRFLERWFAAVPKLKHREHDKKVEMARDNFVLAASYAAGKDVSEFFKSRWRWSVSEAFAGELQKIL